MLAKIHATIKIWIQIQEICQGTRKQFKNFKDGPMLDLFWCFSRGFRLFLILQWSRPVNCSLQHFLISVFSLKMSWRCGRFWRRSSTSTTPGLLHGTRAVLRVWLSQNRFMGHKLLGRNCLDTLGILSFGSQVSWKKSFGLAVPYNAHPWSSTAQLTRSQKRYFAEY